jgi:hypothetical protein
VYFLPPHASDYNPDDYLNGDLKQKICPGIPSLINSDQETNNCAFMGDFSIVVYNFPVFLE